MMAKIKLFANYAGLSSANFVALLTQLFLCHRLVKFNYVYTFNVDVLYALNNYF